MKALAAVICLACVALVNAGVMENLKLMTDTSGDAAMSDFATISCVNNAEYYAAYNIYGVGEYNVPWPSDSSGPTLEDMQVCNEGDTYLALLQNPNDADDAWLSLTKQLITFNINVLNGALVDQNSAVMWQSAWHMMQICCEQSTSCSTTEFAIWIQMFEDINNGMGGVQSCSAAPQVVVPGEDVTNNCVVPQCGVDCAAVCTVGVDGTCECACSCPRPPTAPNCGKSCTPTCVNNVCSCNCVVEPLPPAADTLPCNQCNRPCPAGTSCSCQRVNGCCICECINVTAPAFDMMECDLECEPGCDVVCSTINGVHACECRCPTSADCTCTEVCPSGYMCECSTVNGECQCACVMVGSASCPLTFSCPDGCLAVPYVDADGVCQQRCDCLGCVRDVAYWTANNRLTGAPWPNDGTQLGPLEERQFCASGKTFLEVMQGGSDSVVMLGQEYIAAYLNMLSGASISTQLSQLWGEAGDILVGCCNGQCATTNLEMYISALQEYNAGMKGVSVCAPLCTCTVACDAGCERVCQVADDGSCVCSCACPPDADCVCTIECGEGCECSASVDENGACVELCKCPPTPDCVCSVQCPSDCECEASVDASGVCQSLCICPPLDDCEVDFECPELCTPVVEKVDGVCEKVCVCHPTPDCTCTIGCPVGCECVSYSSENGACINYCDCPPPPDCICDLPCPDECECVCHVNEENQCVCECKCNECPRPTLCDLCDTNYCQCDYGWDSEAHACKDGTCVCDCDQECAIADQEACGLDCSCSLEPRLICLDGEEPYESDGTDCEVSVQAGCAPACTC